MSSRICFQSIPSQATYQFSVSSEDRVSFMLEKEESVWLGGSLRKAHLNLIFEEKLEFNGVAREG